MDITKTYAELKVDLEKYEKGKYRSARITPGKIYPCRVYGKMGMRSRFNRWSSVHIVNDKGSNTRYDIGIFHIYTAQEIREHKLKALLDE